MIASSCIITLKTSSNPATKSFLVENFAGKLLLAQPNNPYARLHVTVDGLEYKSNTPQSNNLFTLYKTEHNQYMLTTTLRDKATKKDQELSLAVDVDGTWTTVDLHKNSPDSTEIYKFDISIEELSTNKSVKRELGVPVFCFEKWQLRRFLNEGYLKLHDIVDHTLLDQCVATINHELGLPGHIVAGGIQEGEGLGKLAGNLSNCAAVRAVLGGKVHGVLNAVFGVDNFENSNLSAQIALRFPELNKPSVLNSADIVWHTDGLRQGHFHGFSLLLGVCLSDVPEDFNGNLAVWPGSHLLLHQCILPPYGALDLQKLHHLASTREHFSNFTHPAPSLPDHASEIHDNEPDLPSFGKPHQLKLRRGDIVLAHPDLAHAGAPNYSSSIRHMLYFRLKIKHMSDEQHHSDMWHDLPVMLRELGHAELQYNMQMYAPEYNI